MNLFEKVKKWGELELVNREPFPQVTDWYSALFEELNETATIRYTPFQNDKNPNYLEKLDAWIENFEEADQKYAFLLACNVIFITFRQLECLQRRLFIQHIKIHLLDDIMDKGNFKRHQFHLAKSQLNEIMNKSIFVANSDSSPLNSFVHVNSDYFSDRENRRLVGPEIRYWVSPAKQLKEFENSLSKNGSENLISKIKITREYEERVLCDDKLIKEKEWLIVVEDFSGSGSDLNETLDNLYLTKLNFRKVLIASCMATEFSQKAVKEKCVQLNKGLGYEKYAFVSAFVLPSKYSCIPNDGGGSYLDEGLLKDLSVHIQRMSNWAFEGSFSMHSGHDQHLNAANAHGFKQSLAFAFYTNCPDNTLPMIWKSGKNWKPLFPRSSRII